jgi:hypothetical protein
MEGPKLPSAESPDWCRARPRSAAAQDAWQYCGRLALLPTFQDSAHRPFQCDFGRSGTVRSSTAAIGFPPPPASPRRQRPTATASFGTHWYSCTHSGHPWRRAPFPRSSPSCLATQRRTVCTTRTSPAPEPAGPRVRACCSAPTAARKEGICSAAVDFPVGCRSEDCCTFVRKSRRRSGAGTWPPQAEERPTMIAPHCGCAAALLLPRPVSRTCPRQPPVSVSLYYCNLLCRPYITYHLALRLDSEHGLEAAPTPHFDPERPCCSAPPHSTPPLGAHTGTS